MAETKYGKYIKRSAGAGSSPEMPGVVPAVLEGLKDWAGIQHRIEWKYVSQPALLQEEIHSHAFEEYLCFLGCDPANPQDFGAEVEITLGGEGERHTINVPSVVCIPGKLAHGRLNFKKVGKPVLFCDIYLDGGANRTIDQFQGDE
jgi:hypothetical protein